MLSGPCVVSPPISSQAMGICQSKQALREKPGQPSLRQRAWQWPKGQQERLWDCRTARSQDRSGSPPATLWPSRSGVDGAQKMPAFDQHVGSRWPTAGPRTRCPDRTVVTNAHVGLAWWSLEIAFYQVKFTHGAELNRKPCGMIRDRHQCKVRPADEPNQRPPAQRCRSVHRSVGHLQTPQRK
jgi:hypothetical protein